MPAEVATAKATRRNVPKRSWQVAQNARMKMRRMDAPMLNALWKWGRQLRTVWTTETQSRRIVSRHRGPGRFGGGIWLDARLRGLECPTSDEDCERSICFIGVWLSQREEAP